MIMDDRIPFGITNSNSVSIEMCLPSGDVTATTEQNTLELVKDIINKYKISLKNVLRHYYASRKNCPTKFISDKF